MKVGRSDARKKRNHIVPTGGGTLSSELTELKALQPVQLYNKIKNPTGEENLLLAVLESAIRDLEKYFRSRGERERRLYLEVKEWVESNAEGRFTFGWICAHLNINPDNIRLGLKSFLNPGQTFPHEELQKLLEGYGRK